MKWTYENFKGASAKLFHDKLEHIRIVDDRTIIFHFKEPFVDFLDLYNGVTTGIGWIVPKHYYEKVGRDGFKARPIGAGPYKFVSQQAGVQMVVEAWDEYWRRTPATKTIVVKGIRDLAARVAGLQTGELDLAYGMTGKLLHRVMADKNLRWDPNFTSAWWLIFPGYREADSPFHDKRVRQAVSLAINRPFLVRQETQGIGKPWGNWISPENRDALKGDGKDVPVPEYNPDQAKQLLGQAGFANGFDFDCMCLSFPTSTWARGSSPTFARSAFAASSSRWRGQPLERRSARAAKDSLAIGPSRRTSIRGRAAPNPTSASTRCVAVPRLSSASPRSRLCGRSIKRASTPRSASACPGPSRKPSSTSTTSCPST